MDNERLAKLVAVVNVREKKGKTHAYSYLNLDLYRICFDDDEDEETGVSLEMGELAETLAALNLHGWRPVSALVPGIRIASTVLLERPL